jgi:hypothetical protein
MESEKPDMNISETDAARMLAEVEAARGDLAHRARAPIWYHPVLGLLAGGLLAVQAAPLAARIAYLPLFAVGLILLVRAYRRKTGMWVSGFRAGRTRWVAVALLVAIWATMGVALWLEWQVGLRGALLVGGLIVTVATTIQGFVWEAAFRRDLDEGGGL